ncbi:MAG: GDP-mannose 4,6-dehydratase [Planctomycetia bacterium]|nr:GDP-mannose 4,6-dehydratase [Planctomycetia bacterium]
MNYLITGGAGFIGSHLTEFFLQRGDNVSIVDDLSTGAWQNVARLDGRPNFHAYIADAADEKLMENEIRNADFVFHLASSVGVKLIVSRPVESIRKIVRPTETVVDLCAKYRKPVLLTSTSETYGKSESVPFREDMDVTLGPSCKNRWAYAIAKLLDEFYLLAHRDQTSLPVYIVRLFNVVGPRQTGAYGMVLPRFISAALANEPLQVYGAGDQTRCFSSVFDIVEGLARVSASTRAQGEVVNMGSNHEISIKELAKRTIELCDSKSEIQFIPYDQAYGPNFDDMQRRVPSLDKAKELFDWNPKRTLDEIIIETRDWLKESGRF